MYAFIFDMDGVIIDSEPIHFEIDTKTMKHFGVEISNKELEKYVGMTNPEMWKLIKDDYNITESINEIINYQLGSKIKILRESNIEPIEGIKELIFQLKNENISIAVASSSPRKFIQEVLIKFNLIDCFQYIVSGEEVAKGKPAPDIYIEAAKQLGVNTEHCIVIKDSRNGVLAAKNAGMKCIGYRNINSGNQNLSQADIVIKSIKEVDVTLLKKWEEKL
ncbi:HAD family phosphatase [Clostridium pasteurianum]|uniref:HAD family hydrolase n=1 Tax=Clostridium pasteurianum TaxID=1501 RepID=UPI0022609274|nr:HAD family phosphatase [Clostridium pasteurianum]UZW15257.1 HAD family phosphatase [Clostridium pasteurianum]